MFSQLWPLAAFVLIYLQQATNSFIIASSIYALCNITQVILEIPSGILSDKISKNIVLSLASLCMLICFVLWSVAGQYGLTYLFFIGSFFYGASVSLQSGTIDAYIYENTVGNKNTDFEYVYAKSNEFAQWGLCISALLATVVTYFYSLQVLVWVNIVPVIIRLIISLLLTKSHKALNKCRFSGFSLLRTFWLNKKLFLFSGIRIIDYSIDLSLHRFESTYFVLLIPKYMISFFSFIKQLFGGWGYKIIQKVHMPDKINMYFQILLSSCICRFVFVIMNNIFTPLLMSVSNIFHGPSMTLSSSFLQTEFTDNQRATMQSVISLFIGIFVSVMMLILGILAEFFSIQIAILTMLLFKVLYVIIARIYYNNHLGGK